MDTLTLILLLAPALVIAIVFHEVAHGRVALMLGDPTAKERNRLSFNPIRHVDPVGTLLVPGMLAVMGAPVFGWAKPVPVIKQRLNNPRFGMMAVAAAGPGMNIALALFGALALGFALPVGAQMIVGDTGMPMIADAANAFAPIASALYYFVLINVFLAVFNMLPIPPFDGSHIVEGALPRCWVGYYAKLRPYGMLLFFGLVAITWFAPNLRVLERTIGVPAFWLLEKYLAIAEWTATLL
ncbi:site-2 protease family protein [Pontixanthobacter aquaemixtae]|uniref:Site-2 protease family protein n=1 Tax=Pontixanthobacter aquaemixtae TaxID=1958940 RepID=A0A844ZSR3_9SPHN|nr:site-2 protease family protein [Pontixanthobacter aquaemixtae]MXO90923.1 site-2 protease family protein [Pontixanthobacter aquaemixtae]